MSESGEETFDCRPRGVEPHAHGEFADVAFAQAPVVLNQLVGIA